MPKRVLIVSARMGAGHDGAAKEIALQLTSRGFDVETRDFLDAAPLIGKILERTYELQLDHAQWSYEALFRIFASFKAIKPPIVSIFYFIFFPRIRKWIKEVDADIVLTTYPFASLVLGRARRSVLRPMKVPAYTFLTDFSVHTMWVDEGIDAYLAVHNISVRQVERLVNKTPMVSGPAVSERFHHIGDMERESIRDEFSIPQKIASALIVAGSWGVGDLKDTLLTLGNAHDIFPVVVCGKNKALYDDLSKLNVGRVIGWTDRMADLMRACDVVIQNAGGLTALEAFAAGVPVVSYNPIKGHGLRNVIEMEASGVSLWAKSPKELIETVHELTANPELTTKRASQVFVCDPGKMIEVDYYQRKTPRRQRSTGHGPVGVLVKFAMALLVIISGANIAVNATTTQLNVGTASMSSPYAYALVTMTPRSIFDPVLIHQLADSGIGAVITGPIALHYPDQVRALASAGVTIVNGGWPINSGLRIFAPIEDATKSQKLILADTGLQSIVYAPVGVVNSVDLAWASLSHVPLVKAVVVETLTKFMPSKGRVYEINSTGMTNPQVEKHIAWMESILKKNNFTLLPISVIGS
ncbi:MGDG synthase family glycosyltransferase [Acidithrix ferrooxidans]|uniref:Processive diacylglycerol beta-glucosyltransferase n=1 Tax=Acidithrix ferrooxidans TaxID=1280514 RepID=A0A0D8HIS0_9ACTN|nr:glycosyltransferase [Acidithrix ferrooxidans]KJF17764.1 processive diacylglycerol beta-glucosyltransferase [Acidithrix ferrooxidans]